MADQNAPVYSAVSTTEREDDSPPSYFNVIGQIRSAKEQSNNPVAFANNISKILCASYFFTIILAISSILPIAMLIVGLMSQQKCTIQPKIPMYLIVGGASGITIAIFRFIGNIYVAIRYRKSKEVKEPKLLSVFINILSIFLFVWFLIGNYWVYSIFNKVQYDTILYPFDYCDKLCYRFAFWTITATWALIVLGCFCICGCLCLAVGVAGLFACLKK